MPNCLGAIDGKHVRIKAPDNSSSDYFNYKKYNSIVLLAVVDAERNFIFVDIGAKGSRSDGGIYENSKLYKALAENNFNFPQSAQLPGSELHSPFYFIGDSAFRLSMRMQCPYLGYRLSAYQENFNKTLSSARKVVENAFGRLYARFGIFSVEIDSKPENVDRYIAAACVLHNFLQKEEGLNQTGFDPINPNNIQHDDSVIVSENYKGTEIRETLTHFLYNHEAN
jgi:hypothetical protein